MYLTLIVLPLLGSIASGFFGRKIGVRGAQLITSASVILTTILSIIIFVEVGLNNIPVSISLFRWIDSESLNIFWGFHFDSLTVSMLIPVLIVSSLVHVYSIGYMNGDPHNQRFFSYLSLFTFMMIILVTADNFLLMFVGWEGVGICSYLLVNFWYTRIAANQSSISALLTNRVGDSFLTVGMFAMLWTFGNIDYSTIFSLAPFINENIITIIGICLLIGAMAKSSQVGLHVWLPMAMEGPTPVSALIHAATMVTAGVYLLMRSSPLIEYSSTVLLLCLWLGAITTVFSSLIGLFQQDIKKVIAYSTMSQLGMMVIAVGLSSYNIALFHLVNHAFYKALLFLGAGSVIHAVADNQDFRKYGGLKPFLPLTYSVMLIASLSLVAFPFMTGFYSKDFILETAYGQYSFSGTMVYFLATTGAMFTTMYSVKVLYLTFITNPNGALIDYKHAHEGDIFMSLPLIILAVFSIFFGFVTKDIFIGMGSDFFLDNALFIHPSNEILMDTEFAVPTLFKLLPLIFTLSLSILFIVMSEFLPKILINFKLSYIGYSIFSFFNQRFFIELIYNKYITNLTLKLGGQTSKVLDKGSVEYFGPYGLEKIFLNLSRKLSMLDTGIVTSYALYILIGFMFYLLSSCVLDINNSYVFILLVTSFFVYNISNKSSEYIIKKNKNIRSNDNIYNRPGNIRSFSTNSKPKQSLLNKMYEKINSPKFKSIFISGAFMFTASITFRNLLLIWDIDILKLQNLEDNIIYFAFFFPLYVIRGKLRNYLEHTFFKIPLDKDYFTTNNNSGINQTENNTGFNVPLITDPLELANLEGSFGINPPVIPHGIVSRPAFNSLVPTHASSSIYYNWNDPNFAVWMGSKTNWSPVNSMSFQNSLPQQASYTGLSPIQLEEEFNIYVEYNKQMYRDKETINNCLRSFITSIHRQLPSNVGNIEQQLYNNQQNVIREYTGTMPFKISSRDVRIRNTSMQLSVLNMEKYLLVTSADSIRRFLPSSVERYVLLDNIMKYVYNIEIIRISTSHNLSEQRKINILISNN